MKHAIVLSALVSLAAVLCAQPRSEQHSALTRDGAHWVLTTQGTAPCSLIGTLRIATRGRVVLRGASVDRIQYSVTQRVKVRTELEARKAFGAVVVNTKPRGETTTLALMTVDKPGVVTEVTLKVPKSLHEATVETQIGGVEVTDMDGMISAITTAGQVSVDRIGANALAKTGGGEIRIGKVGGTVRCNSGAGSIFVESARGETWCDTAGGEISVREVGGPLHAYTEGGNIQVERAIASVSARSGEGLIEVTQAGGLVVAETRGGSIQVGNARGVRCDSGAGTIRFRSMAGPVRASTGFGSILAELVSGARLEDSSLTAGSGDVTVLIPASLSLAVQARNDSGASFGKIISDFPEIRPKVSDYDRARPWIAEGVLNGGGPVLRISATGGTIYIRRQR
ncbi:MAG: hypothetical protein ABI823_04000 [Bryobacteraceae bacterium]